MVAANGKLSGKSLLKTISTTDRQNKVFYSVLYTKSVFLTHTQSFFVKTYSIIYIDNYENMTYILIKSRIIHTAHTVTLFAKKEFIENYFNKKKSRE